MINQLLAFCIRLEIGINQHKINFENYEINDVQLVCLFAPLYAIFDKF